MLSAISPTLRSPPAMAKLPSSTFALGFLRRLLCAHTTGSADDRSAGIAQHGAIQHPAPSPPPVATANPGIVARLMGLDTMPVSYDQALRRSRSASSAESCPVSYEEAPPPRTIRASASFREVPTYLRQENEEFLLLSFSPEEHDKGKFLASRTSDKKRDRAKKQSSRRRKQCRRCRCEEVESGGSRRSAVMECTGGCDQNSSPVSVLESRDVQEESSTSSSLEEQEPSSPISAAEEIKPTTPKQQISRRKLSSEFDHFSSHASKCSDKGKNRRVVNKAEVITPDVSGIWQHICNLVEEDLKNMKWIPCDNEDDGANIVAEIGSEVLDQLMYEAIPAISFHNAK